MCEMELVYETLKAQGRLVSLCPPPELKKGHCICGKRLSTFELNPQRRCSRFLCDPCYHKHWAGVYHTECTSCFRPLSDGTIALQRQNPREFENHLCNNPQCFAGIALIWAVVHGREPTYEERFGAAPQQIQAVPEPGWYGDDVMDTEYVVREPAPQLESPYRALPPPDDSLRVPGSSLRSAIWKVAREVYSKDREDDDVVLVELAKRKPKRKLKKWIEWL